MQPFTENDKKWILDTMANQNLKLDKLLLTVGGDGLNGTPGLVQKQQAIEKRVTDVEQAIIDPKAGVEPRIARLENSQARVTAYFAGVAGLAITLGWLWEHFIK